MKSKLEGNKLIIFTIYCAHDRVLYLFIIRIELYFIFNIFQILLLVYQDFDNSKEPFFIN